MTMTMTELAQTASKAAAAAYAAQKFSVSMAFSEALGAARAAIEAEEEEYNATLALFSSFSSASEEEAALEAERVAAAEAAWARVAAHAAFEAAQAAFHAHEAADIEAYEAMTASHAAAAQAAEEQEEAEYRASIASEGIREFLNDLSSGDRDWVCGEESPEDVAQEWADAGFNALETREWAFKARCYRADSARVLADQGLTPEDCAAPAGYDTIGYAAANGDMFPVR